MPSHTAALKFTLAIAALCACRPVNGSAELLAVQGGLPAQDGGFLVNTESEAARAASAMRNEGAAGVDEVTAIAAHTVAKWYGGWSGDISQAVRNQVNAAKAADATALMIAYNIPNRDCGNHSAGGIPADQYRTWISSFAAALQDVKAMVVLEPDALLLNDCLSASGKDERYQLLKYAVSELKKGSQTRVYIDAGHPNWKSSDDVAARLRLAGIDKADGFVLNSDNYYATDANIAFGQKVRAVVGKAFIIDTGRNGNGANGSEWCNPRGRAVGRTSTMETGTEGVDAFVWLHNPGESDGACNGGPSAGTFWREIAIEQARNGKLSAATTAAPASTPPPASGGGTPSAPIVATTGPAPTGSPGPEADRPTTAATPVTGTPVQPAPAGTTSGALSARLDVKSTWATGYCVDVVVSNTGTTPVPTWTVTINLQGGKVTQKWNASITEAGGTATFRPSYNGWATTLPASSKVSNQGFCVDAAASSPKAAVVSAQ